ncbi:MAG TPA: alkaline phosphatase family protein, partial [Candidatus Aminicenantes bacterium]|nr:alkaline phosphatase family protein [Candidatus Aminicenantes bacterium]
HPLSLLPMLRRSGYMLDVDAGKCHEHPDEFLADIHLAMSLRRQVVEYLWRREEWDVFMNVVTETDRFFHFFYEAWEDERHPRHEELLRIFAEIDDLIGFFLAHPPPGTTLEWLIVSDHGFTRMKREVYLTPLLTRAGFYATSTPDSGDLTGISEKAKAFALDPSRIHLHKRGVYRLGRVKPGDEGTLRRELTDLFESLKVEGEKVVRRVFFREEIFHGRCLELAPDLVLLAEPGFDIKAGHTKSEVSAPSRFSGVHRWDNALLFCSRPALIPESPSVFHVRGLLEQLARPR